MTPRAAAVLRAVQPRDWKRQCHALVDLALKVGQLTRATRCEQCGQKGRASVYEWGETINAHHDDYAKPFDVRWLCPQCHQRLHKVGGVVRVVALQRTA